MESFAAKEVFILCYHVLKTTSFDLFPKEAISSVNEKVCERVLKIAKIAYRINCLESNKYRG